MTIDEILSTETLRSTETLHAFFPRMYGKKVYNQGGSLMKVDMTADEWADYMRSCFEGFFLGDFLTDIRVRAYTDTSTQEVFFTAKATFVSGDKPTEGILRFIKNVKDLNPNIGEFVQLNLPYVYVYDKMRKNFTLLPQRFWKVIQDKKNAEPGFVVNADGTIMPHADGTIMPY